MNLMDEGSGFFVIGINTAGSMLEAIGPFESVDAATVRAGESDKTWARFGFYDVVPVGLG